jgi:hypothetical protein
MHQILVLCQRDWLNPRAGIESHYVREVFTRIVAGGHYVAILSAEPSLLGFLRPRGAATREVDGVHLARLGYGPFYRRMLGAFFARASRKSGFFDRFDTVVDCIVRRPFPVAEYVEIPVLPLVFDLDRRFRSDGDPPGPVIAASGAACDALDRAGFPERFIVRAVPDGESTDSADGKSAGSWDATAGLVLAAIENIAQTREGS